MPKISLAKNSFNANGRPGHGFDNKGRKRHCQGRFIINFERIIGMQVRHVWLVKDFLVHKICQKDPRLYQGKDRCDQKDRIGYPFKNSHSVSPLLYALSGPDRHVTSD